jgi:hypothetical protein
MGLQTVELVIRFEDAFGIVIPDEVAAELTTPRKVTDYILTQVVVGEQPSCLSQQAFYALRQVFVPSLNIQRRDFSPNTQLENLIPLDRRRQIWAGIQRELGVSAVPELARSVWLFSLLACFTLLTFIATLLYAWNNFEAGATLGLPLGLTTAAVVGWSAAIVSRPFKRHFRRGYESAGDLAKYFSTHSPHIFKKETRGWTREQVVAVVREIIVDEVGASEFTEDSHFINDMHLD